jgi:hypothetical protein
MQKCFTEKVNKDMCDYLLSLPLYKLQKVVYDEDEDIDTNWNVQSYLNQVKGYLQKMKDNNYQLKQTYKFSKSMKDKGRLYVDGFGIQTCQYRLRGALLKGICFDYDMVNAHPSILLNIVVSEFPNIDTTYLRSYVTNRNNILIQNKISKVEILKVINKDTNRNCKNPWLKKFHLEIQGIQNAIYEKYKDEYKCDKKYNIKGSVLNQHVCVFENKILQDVVKEFSAEVDVQSIIFDGFTCDKDDITEKLNEFTQASNIKWLLKPHNEDIELEDHDEDDSVNNSYAAVKEDFEKSNFVVKYPLMYCTEIINDDGTKYLNKDKKQEFSDRYENLYFTDYVFDKKTDSFVEKETKFISKWLGDKDRITYDKIDFLPPPLYCSKTTYNTFTGFKYEKIDADGIDYGADISIFLNHIKLLAGDDRNEEVTDYIIKYLAHLIQCPATLPKTSLVFKSLEGIGKNLFFESFCTEILGKEYLLCTADPNHILGRFNNLNNKFIVIMNEVQGKDSFAGSEKIKSFITEPTIIHEEKNKPLVTLNSFSRFLFFSNNDTPVKIGITDRRFQVCECSTKLPDSEYFSKLASAFKDKSQILAFVDYLKHVNIKNFVLGRDRIETDYYKVLKSVNIPPFYRFLYKWILETIDDNNMKIIQNYPSADIYQEYEHFMNHKQYKPVTLTAFGREISKLEGITKGPYKKKICYTVEIVPLVKHLIKNNIIENEEYENIIGILSD